jgi:glycosyltransferase involved in cell wall biosynthesis
MQFSIIIPAFNEEQSIATIIEECRQARQNITGKTPVTSIEIIVVNDGSTDRTAELASQSRDITLISFEKNQGYGAAIKKGFEKASGELVGFLDADGTCDPLFFVDLINKLAQSRADIAIGSRLGPDSHMPLTRRIGNTIFVSIINFLGNVTITDSASGMRVIRKSSLPQLYPLPDGLHFTPAMSCKALMNKNLTIVELPMEYNERKGESKLHIWKDGARFLKAILDAALFFRPLKLLAFIGFALIAVGLIYSIFPISYYLSARRVEDFFIYRLITIMVLFLVGSNFLFCGILADSLVAIINAQTNFLEKLNKNKFWGKIFSPRGLLIEGLILTFSGVILNWPVIIQYVTTGKIYIHWVYVLTGAFLILLGMQIVAFGFLQKIFRMYHDNLAAKN